MKTADAELMLDFPPGSYQSNEAKLKKQHGGGFGDRREDQNLDRHFCLSDRGNHQKTAESTSKSLYNFTGIERLPI
jgi:hypothetical protein